MPKVRYVGLKPSKIDNANHTNVVWKGPGDIQEYPADKLAGLLKHPTVWELVDETGEAPAAPEREPAREERGAEHGEIYFRHHATGEGSLYQLEVIATGEIVDLSELDNDKLKTFARVNRIGADLRKKNDELRANIVAAVTVNNESRPTADGEPQE